MTEEKKKWYVLLSGDPKGPYTEDEVKARLQRGDLSYYNLIFRAGMPRWQPISECKEFERRTGSSTSIVPVTISQETAVEGWVLLVKREARGKEYYVQLGPVTTDQVREKLISGEIRHSDQAWKKGLNDWSVVGSFDDFERRRPKDFEHVPAPKLSRPDETTHTEPFPHTPTPADLTATNVQAPIPSIGKEEATELPSVKARRKKIIVASSGAVLGMAITYIALKSMRHEPPASSEVVAPVVASPQTLPQVPPPQPLAQAQPRQIPQPPRPQPPVLPEVAQRHPATKMEIVGWKLESQHPQLSFETNLSGGAEITVEITAKPGEILRYPSFYLKKKLMVTAGQLPSLDLTAEKLPAGSYNVKAVSENLSAAKQIRVGVQNKEFQRQLVLFKKTVKEKQKHEKEQLTRGTALVKSDFYSMMKVYRPARTKKWDLLLKGWRKQMALEIQSIGTINNNTRNGFVYPEHLLKLKNMERNFLKTATILDSSAKGGRRIASDDPSASALRAQITELEGIIKKLRASQKVTSKSKKTPPSEEEELFR